MNNDIINIVIKLLGIHICTCFTYYKILGLDKLKTIKKFIILFICLITAALEVWIQPYTSNFLRIIIQYIIIATFFSKFEKIKLGISIIITTMSLAISSTLLNISAFIIYSFAVIFKCNYISPIFSMLIVTFTFVFIYLMFKLNRLKDGFVFIKRNLQNPYIDIFIISINAITIFLYFITENYHHLSFRHIGIGIFILFWISVILIQKTFILYQKQKLQTQTLKDYETQLAETQQKLQTAQAEKQTLIKSNHEFYHRQEAIKKKLDDLALQYSNNYNTEFAEELGNISDRLNKMSDEYVAKTNFSTTLPKSNIDEIDDMLSYMKSECDKNNIEFTLRIDCDINHIINNFISTSQLETLLGDLIRNSIIAVNHSTNNYRSIMVIFGIKNSIYELCVLDSGIPFEIDTLLNLGLSPASTHLNEGGTGIGFITTFETVKSCNGSITINEVTNNNYSKSIEIQFDNKNEYRVVSQRKESIIEKNINNRDIIITETI